MIDSLKENQIFVFGSNSYGDHAGGAAKQAHEQFGAEMGIANGLTGSCYAIDTMSGFVALQRNVRQFIRVASSTPQLTYLLTRIGCGIAGYTDEQITPLFNNMPTNVILPDEWNPNLRKRDSNE